MVVIKMPGGDIEVVSSAELQWMREAFEHEFAGTVMLRVGGDRIFSIESLAELRQKFSTDGAGLRISRRRKAISSVSSMRRTCGRWSPPMPPSTTSVPVPCSSSGLG